tara:strand:- start:503 stop:640 length:138 start_codon:yes stop_codon:yes gene_type:complete
MDVVVNEIANIGLTILGFVVFWVLINWLDRNVFNKNRHFNKKDKK